MSTHPLDPVRPEKGVALIIVLLLLAVMTGLATGLAVNGQVEISMASNETYYAGARAAAEAGMNRAIQAVLADSTTDLLKGQDNAADPTNPAAAVNADNGDVTFLLTGTPPYALGSSGQYTYTIRIFDDDDPSLYVTALTASQLTAMGEDGNANSNLNDRLILRATGIGPSGTVVRIARILESVDDTPTTTTTTLANPAILVNGDLNLTGNLSLLGSEGNVHANGNLDLSGNAATVNGDATATGTFTANANWSAGGEFGGGRATVNVPTVTAADYKGHADFILTSSGTITTNPLNPCAASCPPTPVGWTFSGGTWSLTGNTASSATLYVEGAVAISGNPPSGGGSLNVALSIIAEGSINITGRPKFTPENDARIQFVTNGDLLIGGNADLDDPTQVEGQIMVREQLDVGGNPEFQGRVVIQNVDGDTNVYDATTNPNGRRGASLITSNTIHGNMTVTYNGTLGAIETTTTTTGATTYTNNVSGWMES